MRNNAQTPVEKGIEDKTWGSCNGSYTYFTQADAGVPPYPADVLERHFGVRGYFVATNGKVMDDVLVKYLKMPDVESEDKDFKVAE